MNKSTLNIIVVVVLALIFSLFINETEAGISGITGGSFVKGAQLGGELYGTWSKSGCCNLARSIAGGSCCSNSDCPVFGIKC
jgi:hypothetical protein